jgi:hypothetical protein
MGVDGLCQMPRRRFMRFECSIQSASGIPSRWRPPASAPAQAAAAPRSNAVVMEKARITVLARLRERAVLLLAIACHPGRAMPRYSAVRREHQNECRFTTARNRAARQFFDRRSAAGREGGPAPAADDVALAENSGGDRVIFDARVARLMSNWRFYLADQNFRMPAGRVSERR